MGISKKEHELDAARKEIERLKQRLRLKDNECVQLRDKVGVASTQVLGLEGRFRDRAAKVPELIEIVGGKSHDGIGEKLAEKGLQDAEVQVANLQKRLQDTEWKLERAKKEQKKAKQAAFEMSEDNNQLTQELQDAKADKEHLMQERETYKPLILELSDVVRSLNTISVTYAKIEKDHNVPSSAAEAQVHSIRNVKRKVEAIEEDRQVLFKENEALRAEIKIKNQQIIALESQYHLLNTNRLGTGEAESLGDLSARGRDPCGKSTALEWQQSEVEPIHGSTKITEEPDMLSTTSSSSSCSETSSFSSIEPPSIALEKYEKLRHEHQTALFKVSELEEKLKTAPVPGDEFQESNELQSVIEDISERYPGAADGLAEVQLMCTVWQRRSHEINLQYSKLKQDYDDALKDHISQYQKFKQDLKNATLAHDKKSSVLEEVRRVALKKQIAKYERLMMKSEKSRQILRDALDKLKQDHDLAVKMHSEQYEDIKQEYAEALAIHARIEEELRTDRATQVNEKIQELTIKYDEASQRCYDLDQELVLMRQKNEEQVKNLAMANKKADDEAKMKLQRLKQQYKDDLEERTILEKELQEVMKKAEQRAQESYNKLKQEYDLSEAEKLEKEEELRELRRQLQQKTPALDEYSELKRLYKDANIKFSNQDLLVPGTSSNVDKDDNESLTEAIANAEALKNASFAQNPHGFAPSGDSFDPKRETDGQPQQIVEDETECKDFETGKDQARAKQSPIKSYLQSKSQEAELPDPGVALENIEKLEDELLKDVESAPRTQEDRFNRLKSDYILHQHRWKHVHDSIVAKDISSEAASSIQAAVDLKIMDRLLHQQKLQLVNDEIVSNICVEGRNHACKNVCSSVPNGKADIEDCCDSLGGSVETIVMSTMEEGINFINDEIANDAFHLGESAIFRSSGRIPKSLHICKSLSHVSSISQSICQVDTRGEQNNLHVRPKDIGFTDMELKQELDVAKIQISSLHQELNKAKEKELTTRKEKAVLESGLREVIERYRTLERQHQDAVAKLESQDLGESNGQRKQKNFENDLKTVISQYRKLERDYEDLLKQQDKTVASTVTDLRTSRSWSSAYIPEDPSVATRNSRTDMRDSHSACSNRQRMGGGDRDVRLICEIENFMKLRQEHDAAQAKISAIGKELDDAKKVAEAAKKKQVSRENHLKNVITKYKKLESERDALIAEIQDARRESGSASRMTNLDSEAADIVDGSEDNSILKDAKSWSADKIAEIEKQLQDARVDAEVAKLKQAEKDKHLRDVIFHYKKLQMEHDALMAHVSSLKGELNSTTSPGGKLEENEVQKFNPPKSINADTKGNNTEKNQLFYIPKKAPKRQTTLVEPEICFV